MTSKTTIGLAAVGLALLALAPVANAAIDDDVLGRTFPYVSTVRGEVAGDGIGWYDSGNPPNICIVTLLGVQGPVGGSFYYETARVYLNLAGSTPPQTVGAPQAVPAPCPAVLNPLCNVGCALHVQPIAVGPAVRTIVPQDGLICTQQSGFVTCIATSGAWEVNTCAWNDASFVARSDPNKGFFAGTGLHNLALSEDINCAAYGTAADHSGLLGSDGNPLSSGFEGIVLSNVVGPGSGSSYFVSCLTATYTTIDTSVVPPTVGSDTEDGVDYFLTLDLGTAGATWADALAAHLVGSGAPAAPGLYDLGGGNDCDF